MTERSLGDSDGLTLYFRLATGGSMARKDESVLAWILASVGLAAAGFAAGVHRLVWGLFWILAAVWCVGVWALVHHNGSGAYAGGDLTLYWLPALVPPIVVAVILRLVEGIVVAVFGGHAPTAERPPPSSGSAQLQRRRFGYDRDNDQV